MLGTTPLSPLPPTPPQKQSGRPEERQHHAQRKEPRGGALRAWKGRARVRQPFPGLTSENDTGRQFAREGSGPPFGTERCCRRRELRHTCVRASASPAWHLPPSQTLVGGGETFVQLFFPLSATAARSVASSDALQGSLQISGDKTRCQCWSGRERRGDLENGNSCTDSTHRAFVHYLRYTPPQSSHLRNRVYLQLTLGGCFPLPANKFCLIRTMPPTNRPFSWGPSFR